MITTSAYKIASKFIGIKEIPGSGANPQIMAMLKLENLWPAGDEVAWCGAFAGYVAWLLDLPRSHSLAARSWLKIGTPISIEEAKPDCDIVIVKRGGGPGPEVIEAPGHVGFFAGRKDGQILILGGIRATP